MNIIPLLLTATLVAASLAPSPAAARAFELPTDVSKKAKPATIKVLISKQQEKVLLEAKGRYNIYDPENNLLITSGASSKRDFLVTSDAGFVWGETYPGILQMRMVPGDSQSTILVDGIEYRGCVEIYDIQGKLYVLNEVDMERYLKSVLSCQFDSKMSDEVLEALAIVARTNAYYYVQRHPEAHWHVDAREVGYQGYALTLQNIHVDRAVTRTRNMIMTYHGGPFAAGWTHDSAGRTANFATIFRKDAKTPQGVVAPIAAKERDKHGWFFEISKQELARIADAQMIHGVDLYQDKESQKVYAMRVHDQQQNHSIDFAKLQRAIGPTRLKSNDFTVEVKGDKVVFKGFGEGSGVGLCLLSAQQMAEKGAKAPEILSTFFPETKLEHLPAQTK